MDNRKIELYPSLLGKFLGKGKLTLEGGFLTCHIGGRQVKSYRLADTIFFASIHKGLFGLRLTYRVDENTKETFGFLSSMKAEDFLNRLNESIGEGISSNVAEANATFDCHVKIHYPRDSKVDQLSSLVNRYKISLSTQSEYWVKYVPYEAYNQAKEIASFCPFNIVALREFHENFWLKERKVFFDKVESNPLTVDQRLGVLRSNDRNMVLAAAGTGKTSVIVAKALDVIDRGLADPKEVLVLAYNRSAANEIKERLQDKANKNSISNAGDIYVSTFHSLGKDLLRRAGVATYLSAFVEDGLKLEQWVTDWITNYIKEDVSRVYYFIDMRYQPVNPFNFASQEEYERYIRDNEYRTLKGDLVKGYQELVISNFLFVNQIPYGYESQYVTKKRIDIGFDYSPDFHLTGTNIYIEHFGIDRKGNTRPDIDAVIYNENIRKKRNLHRQYRTDLIETFHYEFCEGTLLSNLKDKLEKRGIDCLPMPDEDIFKILNEQGYIADWAKIFIKVLQAIRVEALGGDEIRQRVKEHGIANPYLVADVLQNLHEGYQDELKKQDRIDFDDMILRAQQVVADNRVSCYWKYILVDEYQDISTARMNLVSELVNKGPEPSLTVVGDDWQSIYRFSGGKLELTTRFEEMVGGYTQTILQKSFRYNSSIAKVAGQFIMENPEQFKKNITTHALMEESQVYLLDDRVGLSNKGQPYVRLQQIIKKIKQNDPGSSIAVIARYNRMLDESRAALKDAKLNSGIEYWTFHGSKGLEADYCVLVGFYQGKTGFPNSNQDEAVVEALLPSLNNFPHSEERRLLYVGLTRGRKKCYLIADPTSPSSFVSELLAPKYNINIASKTFQKQFREIFKCPNCKEGYLRFIEGRFGGFYSCSSGLACPVGKARVCEKCNSPSIDLREKSVCNNRACKHSFRICDQCGRPMRLRNGRYGQFWGCSGYGIEGDQCRNTRNQ